LRNNNDLLDALGRTQAEFIATQDSARRSTACSIGCWR